MRRALALLIAGAVALAAAPAAAAQAPAAPSVAAPGPGAAPGGLQVGPPLPPAPAPPGGEVTTDGGDDRPFFLNIPGQIKKAIDDWFRGLVTDALDPTMELVGKTVLATPQVTTQPRVAQLWQVSLGIADALLVLFVIAGGVLVMSHETIQTRYALKDILPRVAIAALAVNASLALSGQLIAIANALSAGLMGAGVDPAGAATRLGTFVLGAIRGGGIFLTFLGLACAVVAVVLLVLYIVRGGAHRGAGLRGPVDAALPRAAADRRARAAVVARADRRARRAGRPGAGADRGDARLPHARGPRRVGADGDRSARRPAGRAVPAVDPDPDPVLG
jgi:hypothetical protein